MDLGLTVKVAIVTGGTANIGSGLCWRWRRRALC